MKKQLGFLILALFLAFPISASADIIDTVSITEVPSSPDGYVVFPTLGGNTYHLDYDLSINGGSLVEAFCVEEESGPHNNAQSYTLITINEAGDFGLIQANYDAAALVANYYFENCLGNDADESCKAASQIAVWELIFDGPGAFNLTGGSFTSSNIFNSEANTIWGLAQVTPTGQHYVLAVNPTVDYGDDVVVAEFQNYLVPVPEPSTIVLIGLGLCGLGVFARRKK